MRQIRRYGVIYLFLFMWLGTSALFWHFDRQEVRNDAAQHCELHDAPVSECFDEDEFRTDYWSKFFENHQSEYAQLFFQAVFIGALGLYVFKKEKEDIVALDLKLNALLLDRGIEPDRFDEESKR